MAHLVWPWENIIVITLQGLIEFVPDAVTVCKVQTQEASKNANGDIAKYSSYNSLLILSL